jgi:hypothetical protein
VEFREQTGPPSHSEAQTHLTMATKNKWLPLSGAAPATEPALRLFCFPQSGTGAWVYKAWQKALPESVQVGLGGFGGATPARVEEKRTPSPPWGAAAAAAKL